MMQTHPLVGRLLSDFPEGHVIPPEIQRVPCATCGGVLLLAPSSVALIQSGRARPLCAGCLAQETQAGTRYRLVMTAEQQEEAAKYHGGAT